MKLRKDNIKYLYLLIIFIISFLLGKQCSNNSSKTNYKPITDTLILHKVDTIKSKDTIVKYAFKLKYKIDTLYQGVFIDSTNCNLTKLYEDSIITNNYNLYKKSYIKGLLINDTIGVKLKVPLKIIDSTKIYITKHDTVYKPNIWSIKAGMLVSPNTLAPSIDYTKNKITTLHLTNITTKQYL